MGNTFVGSSGGSVFDWCRGSFVTNAPIALWRVLRFLVFVVWTIVGVITTFLGIVFALAADFLSLFRFILFGLFAFFILWYYYPDLQPYWSTTGVELVNLGLQLFQIAWNLLLILYNLFQMVWNAFAPLIGMLIYVVMDVVSKLLTVIVQILGEIDVYALLKPLMEILEFLAQILVELIQALVSVLPALLQAFAKIVGPIINVIMAIARILFIIIRWAFITFYPAFRPVLEFVIAVVKWFTSWFAASAAAQRSLQSVPMVRTLQSIIDYLDDTESRSAKRSFSEADGGDDSPYSGLHEEMYARVYSAGRRHWSDPDNNEKRRTELDFINEFLDNTEIHSFDYYWTVHRPYLSHLDYSDVQVYTGESYAGAVGGRALLEHVKSRGLLSAEEVRVLEEPAVDEEEYWARLDRPGTHLDEHLDWFVQAHYKRERQRKAIVERVKDQLFARDAATEGESAAKASPRQKHPFGEELDAKVECKRHACGGHGKLLRHPVHSLRKLIAHHKAKPDRFVFKDARDTDEQHARSRFVHGTVLAQASLAAFDTFKQHAKNPMLHRHIREAFNRTTGFSGLGELFDHYYAQYSDPAEFIHEHLGTLSDWGLLRMMKEEDPERHTRPYYSDWVAAQRTVERRDPRTGRRTLSVEPTPAPSVPLKLLDMDESDPSYAFYREWSAARELLEFPINLPDVPDAEDQRREAAERDSSLNAKRPQPRAALPLFDLLTKTNCYDSVPRNPLCLPKIPESWRIRRVPVLVWPEEATPDDTFCQPVFKTIDRDLTNWRTYLGWEWFYNALQTVRLIFSTIPGFTTTLGVLARKYPWAAWLFRLPLALPPGKRATTADWICAILIFGPYAWWLVIAIAMIVSRILWPLVDRLILAWGAYTALVQKNVDYDEARAEAAQRTENLFATAARDTRLNPATGALADRDAYRRGVDGRIANYMPGIYGASTSQLRYAGNASAYAVASGRNQRLTHPFGMTQAELLRRNSPMVHDPETGEVRYGASSVDPASVPRVRDASAPIESSAPPPQAFPLSILRY